MGNSIVCVLNRLGNGLARKSVILIYIFIRRVCVFCCRSSVYAHHEYCVHIVANSMTRRITTLKKKMLEQKKQRALIWFLPQNNNGFGLSLKRLLRVMCHCKRTVYNSISLAMIYCCVGAHSPQLRLVDFRAHTHTHPPPTRTAIYYSYANDTSIRCSHPSHVDLFYFWYFHFQFYVSFCN